MVLLIPIGFFHSVRLSGRAAKEVHCEVCNSVFYYVLSRTVTGYSFRGLLGDESAADERATERGERKLRELMLKAVDPVLCPSCGTMPSNAVPKWRRSKFWQFLAPSPRVGFSAAEWKAAGEEAEKRAVREGWACPKCNAMNPNNVYRCRSCRYSLI